MDDYLWAIVGVFSFVFSLLLLLCCLWIGCTDEFFAHNSTRRATSGVGNASNPNTTRGFAYNMKLAAMFRMSKRLSGQTEAAQPLLQNNPTEERDVEEYSPPQGECNPQEEFCPSQGGYNPTRQCYNPTNGGCNLAQQSYNTDHQGSGYVDPQSTTTNDPSKPYTDNSQAC